MPENCFKFDVTFANTRTKAIALLCRLSAELHVRHDGTLIAYQFPVNDRFGIFRPLASKTFENAIDQVAESELIRICHATMLRVPVLSI